MSTELKTERLQKCFDAGSVVDLFPLLKDWPRSELSALLEDIDRYADSANDAIDSAHKEQAFRPEMFFSRKRSEELDKAVHSVAMDIFAMCSEISSVALYYLGNEEATDAH